MNHVSKISATSFVLPTHACVSFPRRVMVMKSRGVGFRSPSDGDDPVPPRLCAGEACQFGIGEGLVDRLRAEVEVGGLRQQHQ